MGTKTFDGRGQGRGEVARFTFGKHDLFWQYRINPTLRAIIDTGNYVYLDGRLCLKTPNCFSLKNGIVKVNITSEADLGAYCVAKVIPVLAETEIVRSDGRTLAGTHKTKLQKTPTYSGHKRRGAVWHKPAHAYRCHRRTNRAPFGVRKGTYIHARMHQSLSAIDKKTFLDFTSGGGEPPSGTFGQGVKFYIKREGITQAILAERVGVATDTIGRICRDVYEPPMNMAVAVCIGLHLLPFESRKLLSRLGYTLDGNSPIIRAYQLLIDVFYSEEVCDCNTFLVEKGLKPLTKETE